MPKKKKNATTKKTPRKAARKIEAGGPRKCAVCGKKGHNKRSHEPGGRLAK
jgi:hypothetical protein